MLLLGTSFSGEAQSCNTQLAHWGLESCVSIQGSSDADYSEFTANITTPSTCGGNISASTVFREQGTHSCTPGANGSVGMCVGTASGCTFTNNDPYAIRFEVTIQPGNNGEGKLSGLHFYEKSPTQYNWIDGASGANNYPKKYGVRVTKNGQEVFKSVGNSTTSSWSLESFDFSNDADFTVTTTTTFKFELRGYCRVNNGASVSVWDIDEIEIIGCCASACNNQGGDNDADGVCANVDCDDNNPNVPATVGSSCDDGNANTENDVIQADGCSCAGTPITGGADCNNIGIAVETGKIIVSGLDGAPISSLQIFNSSWSQEYSCFADCSATETVNLPAGNYYVYAKYYNESYALICQENQTVTVVGGACPDADNDGTCDAEDCQPSNPAYPAAVGSACNDGNPNTVNDVVQADGCTCIGTGGATGVLPAPLHPKFVNDLPDIKKIDATNGGTYEISMEESQQWLGLVNANNNAVQSTVWGYTYNNQQQILGPTFVAKKDVPIDVKWVNNLPYQHLLPIDASIHQANPTSGVPTVVHLHGGHTEPESDGFPDSWYTQNFAEKGSTWAKETYHYTNDQEATTLWYHDHTLGITRLNNYAGLAGMYLLTDDHEPTLNLPSGNYERELVVQDKQFAEDGSLYFPALLTDAEAADFPTNPNIEPTIFPEFFGDYIMVNGMVWPKMEVEPGKYRFRLLNGSDSRFYIFKLSNNATFQQIGTDGGLLNNPVSLQSLLLGPAERADIIIDFSGMQGQSITMLNVGPDEPFQGSAAGQAPADPNTTGCIMQFEVGNSSNASFTIPNNLRQLPIQYLGEADKTRQLLLLEGMDQYGRLKPSLGTVDLGTRGWLDPVTETPIVNETEIWEIYNATGDAHPIHIHQISFELMNRQDYTGDLNPETSQLTNIQLVGAPEQPAANEKGWKDTVIVPPGQVARFKMRFDIPGRYVWHCHILSHEDWDMMRPLTVLPADDCANAGGDNDNDGVCASDDCDDNNPNVPATVGSSCDDGNANTTNDVIGADGCSCSGTPISGCDNVDNGGQIGSDQTVCAGDAAATLTNVQTPTGGTGTMEYLWLSSTSGCPTSLTQEISGATSSTYNPGTLTSTTSFVRCSRRAGCSDWTIGESNCVTVTVDNSPNCGGGGNEPDCNDISITIGEGSITVSGLDGAPVSSLQIFSSNWQQQFSCFANCNATETVNLPAGDYYVYVKYYTAAYALICQENPTVTVTGAAGCPDADNDGVCDADDCQPNNPAFPATVGSSCDDGNPNTDNDVVQSDGCSCAGTATESVEITDCGNHRFIFTGNVDYKVIGNSMNYSEAQDNCNKKSSSSANLSVPSGATVVKAYLHWSGSKSSVDNSVKLNGQSVSAQKTYQDYSANLNFFGAYAEVTSLVQAGGNYTVSGLSWDNGNNYCNANAAYGAWSLVVVYSKPGIQNARIHVYQDKFEFTYPANTYSSSINCVEASSSCSPNAELTLVTFESDDYKGEYLTIEGNYWGDNLFHGQTAPNLDIAHFDISSAFNPNSSHLDYSIESYFTNTIWGPATEGLFDFVKILKYDVCAAPSPLNAMDNSGSNTTTAADISIIEKTNSEKSDLIDFTLFPNPANNMVKINLASLVGQEVDIQVYNTLGSRVKMLHLNEVNEKHYSIDLSEIESGYYTVWVSSPNKSPKAVSLIISK